LKPAPAGGLGGGREEVLAMRFVVERDLRSTAPDATKFTAGVWQTEALSAIRDEGLRAHRFLYEPGAHSHWHTHTGEQAIAVVAGCGVVVRWGEESGTAIGPGDWVHVEPGEKHWHGALPDDVLVHLAVTASGRTEWHGPVSDAEYQTGVPSADDA
jgi:quercetin dioxygenase-like cupin family protein